jgi:metal-responsive CopG/Arc/MetJ family transcriptional regulator
MKVAISLPDPVFDAAETLAASLNKSRSELYSDALQSFIATHMAHDVTRRLNDVYASEFSALDPVYAKAQRGVLAREAW